MKAGQQTKILNINGHFTNGTHSHVTEKLSLVQLQVDRRSVLLAFAEGTSRISVVRARGRRGRLRVDGSVDARAT